MNDKAVALVFDSSDRVFFQQHLDRQAHIRLPYKGESDGDFWTLGAHNRARRRILLWRVPANNPHYDPVKQPLLKIPFLAYADETIEDTDDILLPIIHTIMTEARKAGRG